MRKFNRKERKDHKIVGATPVALFEFFVSGTVITTEHTEERVRDFVREQRAQTKASVISVPCVVDF